MYGAVDIRRWRRCSCRFRCSWLSREQDPERVRSAYLCWELSYSRQRPEQPESSWCSVCLSSWFCCWWLSPPNFECDTRLGLEKLIRFTTNPGVRVGSDLRNRANVC